MSTAPPNGRRPARLEDLLSVPEHLVGEILEGELVVSPQPAAQSVFTRTALRAELGRRRGAADGAAATGTGAGTTAGSTAGWWIFDQPRLRLGTNVLVPDLTGWRRQRMPKPPQNNNAGTPTFELPPDWVCEVLSPSSAVLDRTRKLGLYASHGVCWLWLVDAVHRTVEVLWLEGDEWVVAGNFGGDQKARMPPFDAIELELGSLWEPSPSGSGVDIAALSSR